ncbi:MAG: glycosyltransferase [Helicobacteraceae bacterium]|nr:glycosyltransferase [Helicobacteraceae bacterium]
MKKNIVLIIDSLAGGGAERSNIKIATMLVEQGYNVSVILIKNIIEFDFDKRINIIQLNYKRAMLSSVNNKKYASKLKIAIKTVEDKFGKINFIAGSLGLTHKLMNLANIDGYYVARDAISVGQVGNRKGIKRLIKLWKLRKLYNNKKILTVSKGVEEDILELGIKPKTIQTMYNPYDYEYIRSLSNEKIDFDLPTEEYLVHVGRFEKQKNHTLLLNVFSKLQNKTIKLVLVGKGSDEEQLKNLVEKLNIKERVIFSGFHKNPYPIIKNAKAFILTSEHEGLPTVLIEALALNIPVVSTDCPSGPYEILTPELKNYLCLLNDELCLIEKINDILINPPQIPKSILTPYSVETVLKEYKKLFN